jgi:hypothetical protein
MSNSNETLPAHGHFFELVREERLFCATLFHLLLQRGNNLTRFIRLLNEKLPLTEQLDLTMAEEAELYVEFTFLRDSWFALGRNNAKKRHLLGTLLQRIPSLGSMSAQLPKAYSDLNAWFMGHRGARIKDDIVLPGQWSVSTLFENFKSEPDVFRDLCRFKWSFNIKPDLVIFLPDAKPICIEAKLESREGSYPATAMECAQFDELFGKHQRRVGQFELQQFMFGTLLQRPSIPVVVAKSGRPIPTTHDSPDPPTLSWHEVFAVLDTGGSLGFVERLIRNNRPISPQLSSVQNSV